MQAAHLVRRTGFGAAKRDVDQALFDGGAPAAAARLVAEAQATPIPEPPGWYRSQNRSGVQEVYDLQRSWFEAMRADGLVEKMTLFWHNHFVTQWSAVQGKTPRSVAHLTYDYYKLLRLNALGNVRTLIRSIGLNGSMLVYLDGDLNTQGQANENYGRELLELFSMGPAAPGGGANYTEEDVREVARALTGWVVASSNRAAFDPARHDAGQKTIFGRTGPWGYDDVIDLIFEERAEAVAHFICRKLYCFFVQSVPNEGVVAALAAELRAHDFELAPVVRTLLASAHFYAPSFIAGRIKSPVELLIGFLREAELAPNRELLENLREALTPTALSQELFNPPDVAGWRGLNPPGADGQPGHYTWLTTGTLPLRWDTLEGFLGGANGNAYDPVDLARKISDPSDPFRLPTDLAAAFLPVPLAEAGIHDIQEDFAGDPALPPPPEFLDGPAYAVNLTKLLLDGTPHYEWPRFAGEDRENEAEARQLLLRFLAYLLQLPEYQLT
ncbi:MAG: DUF1800 domain-containing protein [Rhodothermales bacterium]|nr:DUF1800 domain-containing protein [Rhodothermales bacterium]